ncbi:hypothetical protein GGR88_000686 [Sphingomonas jejuensis]|uniref:Uncharacterized protein n=1 Tax=Sphingomonas jejuensis TaxID=904715 RepID=A0ABX0XKA0_9SPHN|nr:hypothetical protein [Sphingomonas jejuensis]NJC33212.1 hypothetical protein [Sphingomonas jejuensis]
MFQADPLGVFSAVDEVRGVVIYQTMVMAGDRDDPGGEVWFIEIARSARWALKFERRRTEPGDGERVARFGAGGGQLPDESQCRTIIADYMEYEERRLTQFLREEPVPNLTIKIGGYIHSGSFAEETDRYPVALYGF